ncbi:hypothetical protein SD70_24465 [Gordoniibacillus kamchatkensis]|uniref:Nucleoside-diphosphate sugar epimerase n=1 Tax=Gordoniibacillus kamchatkensis TaxID=1590651 RepID=A0ABR5ACI3_9BACL|nr:hypothetical protein [Paenibacillus sp. VKM B-2647]KIL38759.1 hypothetical protein SD70_24465 [Paenibacillus sp. VKM B-2647]
MQREISAAIAHLSESQREAVRIMEAEKHVVCHMSGLIAHMPDELPFDGELQEIVENASIVTKSVTAYLNSLAELEDALVIHLELALKELSEPSHDE